MAPCGMQFDEVIARMKASGVPGTEETEKILEQLLCADMQEPIEAEELQTTIQETGPERITT